MQFILYTDQSIKQCTTALTERMEVKGTKARPEIGGRIEKGGKFTLEISGQIAGALKRTTRLRATMERENGVTVIRGFVPSGVPRERILIVMGSLLFVGLILFLNGSGLLGIVAMGFAIFAYIALVGDYNNREYLIKEVKKILKAKETPPNTK